MSSSNFIMFEILAAFNLALYCSRVLSRPVGLLTTLQQFSKLIFREARMATNESPEEIEELDSVHVDALLKAVEKAGEKPSTSVRIFERNEYY